MCFVLADTKLKKKINRIFVNSTAYFHPQHVLYSFQCLIYKRYQNIKIQMLNSLLIGKINTVDRV